MLFSPYPYGVWIARRFYLPDAPLQVPDGRVWEPGTLCKVHIFKFIPKWIMPQNKSIPFNVWVNTRLPINKEVVDNLLIDQAQKQLEELSLPRSNGPLGTFNLIYAPQFIQDLKRDCL